MKQIWFAFLMAASLSAQVTVSTLAVDFSPARSFRLPITCTATLDGQICYDPVLRFYRGYGNGVLRNLAFTDSDITGNAATSTTAVKSATTVALATTPTLCAGGSHPLGIDVRGNAVGCSADSSIYDPTKSGTLYLGGLLSGGSGLTVLDIAGAPTLFVMPIMVAGSDNTGNVLVDKGVVPCGTISTTLPAGIICRQLGWVTLVITGTPGRLVQAVSIK